MIRWLDRSLGSVPMYKLVLFSLAAVTLTALVLSLFGQLAYQPLPILASAAVAVGVSSLTGWLAALIVRRPWHPDSSFITGVLIALIIVPTLDPIGLLGIAQASVAERDHVVAVDAIAQAQIFIEHQEIGQRDREIIHLHLVVDVRLSVVHQLLEDRARRIGLP